MIFPPFGHAITITIDHTTVTMNTPPGPYNIALTTLFAAWRADDRRDPTATIQQWSLRVLQQVQQV